MKRLFSFLTMVIITMSASAFDFELNGLEYTITSTTDKTVEVSGITSYDSNLNIPENVEYAGSTYRVTSIGERTFYGCSSLTSVTIPNSVTAIGESAFYGCSGLKKVIVSDIAAWCKISFANDISNPLVYAQHLYSNENTEITDLVIPSSVTSIGSLAFANCTNLTSITIPSSVTRIGQLAFTGCTGLTSITVDSNNSNYDSRNDCNAIIETSTNTLLQGCNNTMIPNTVTGIGWLAFYGCSGLTSVTIPNSVTSIDTNAFSGCSGLKKVIVSDLAAWCKISFAYKESNPLQYAHHLYSDENTEITDLVIPNSVTEIGQYAFFSCSGLTSVTIPNSVTSIKSLAFEECTNLTSVIIGNSVTSIGYQAFEGCYRLKKVIVSDLAAWCKISFAYEVCNPLRYAHHLYSDENTEITDLVIPNSVTEIGQYAFFSCDGLTSVTIPNSVTSIGKYAFYGCINLKRVISLNPTPPTAYHNTFSAGYYENVNDYIYNYCTLYIPLYSMPDYSTSYPCWAEFKNIVEHDITNINSPIVENKHNDTIYHINGIKANGNNLGKGIYIKNGKKYIIK